MECRADLWGNVDLIEIVTKSARIVAALC